MNSRSIKLVLLGILVIAVGVAGSAVWLGKGSDVPAAIVVDDPTSDELEAFASTRVFFGHQSVGSNVISGVESTYAALGSGVPEIVETRVLPSTVGGVLAHTHVGVNGDPFGKFEDFAAALDGPIADQIDVAVIKLCYADIVSDTDVEAVFDEYVAMMDRLEAEHPSVRFVYTTVPLTTDRGWKAVVKSWIGRDDQMGPADNQARQRYNELIREKYGHSGQLFDIAAVESTLQQEPAERGSGDETYYVLNGPLAADPGHLNDLGARLAAAEFIRVVAASETS